MPGELGEIPLPSYVAAHYDHKPDNYVGSHVIPEGEYLHNLRVGENLRAASFIERLNTPLEQAVTVGRSLLR